MLRTAISWYRPLRRCGGLIPLSILLAGVLLCLVVPHNVLAARGGQAQRLEAADNPNCSLIVPQHPLTARGLATPYQLVATNPHDGACHEANALQSAFVQAAILDPQQATISIYSPLVIDQGSQPAVPPVLPQLPHRAVVGIWFGFNGTTLTLQESGGSLGQGQCVNGLANHSPFGQVAYCHATAFFRAANRAIQAGTLVPPPLGIAQDGQTCPSVRDFSLVDQDQSDNVPTTYLATQSGQIAQFTQANRTTLGQGAAVLANGSDNRLLDRLVDKALGCTPWLAPDLADPGQMVPAQPLNELQAAAFQGRPVALVPNDDPMVLVHTAPNLTKLNAYRAGVDQPPSRNSRASSTTTYCHQLLTIAPARLLQDEPFTQAAPSPDPNVASNLFTFLAQRFVFTYEANGLNCPGKLHQPDPVTVMTDAGGVTISATIQAPNASTPPTPTSEDPFPGVPSFDYPPFLGYPPSFGYPPFCLVNRTVGTRCNGERQSTDSSAAFP